MSSPLTPRSRFSWPMAAVLIVLILALLGGFVFYELQAAPLRVARQVQEAFGAVTHLQPRVTVHDRIILQAAAPALELTVMTRDEEIERDFEEEWLGSTKRFKLRAVYRVRAGFDLSKTFEARVEDRNVVVELAPPRVLSVDQTRCEVLAYSNGLWNEIKPDEVANELRQLPGEAMQQAIQAGLPKEARQSLQRQLNDKLSPEYHIEIKIHRTLPEIAPPRG